MKNKLKKLFALLLMISYLPNIYAATGGVKLDDPILDGKETPIKKVYKNLNKSETDYNMGNVYKLTITDGDKKITGYCIDFAAELNSYYDGVNTTSLYDYLNQGINNATKTKALVAKINQYTKLGYGYNGKTDDKYYLATQILIWEAINESGFYNSDFYKSRTDEGIKYNLSNIGFTKTNNASDTIDLTEEINQIKKEIANYSRIPSQCSSQTKLEIAIGETATYTDNNKVLSQYKINCSEGLKCEVSGNDLKITALSEGKEHKITFTKVKIGSASTLYTSTNKSQYQGVISAEGEVPTITCNFGVDAYKNVQTGGNSIAYITIIGLSCGIASYAIFTINRRKQTI